MTIGEAAEPELETLTGSDGYPAEGHACALEGSNVVEAPPSDAELEVDDDAAPYNTVSPFTTARGYECIISSSTCSSLGISRPRSSTTLDTQILIPSIVKGKGKAILRGRTLERESRSTSAHPFSNAESRLRDNSATIDVDVRPVKRRKHRSRSTTLYESPLETCPELEDHLLEPCPETEVCKNVAEVLGSYDTTGDQHGFQQPKDDSIVKAYDASTLAPSIIDFDAGSHSHRETFHSHGNIPYIPTDTQSTNGPQVEPASPINNLSSQPLGNDGTSTLSAAQRLPMEMIQQIYFSLVPADFNAARHTCRSWFLSSFGRSILDTMIRRGGWTLATNSEISANPALIQHNHAGLEWLMSKHVSQECALGPDWTGNGLHENKTGPASEHNTRSAFVHSCTADFKEVGVHSSGKSTAGSIFTMSSCGKYLIVSNGCLIYVYELNAAPSSGTTNTLGEQQALRPVTSIICPHRVLACSMDTSSSRHAIAVLLENRIGLVVDIVMGTSEAESSNTWSLSESAKSSSPTKCSIKHNDHEVDHFFGAVCLDRVSFHSSASRGGASHTSSETRFVFPGIFTTTEYSITEEAAWQAIVGVCFPGSVSTGERSTSSSHLSHVRATRPDQPAVNHSQSKKGFQGRVMPLEKGPRSLYRDLCSDDDPPRSVAICPQRRCVAFGCASGIELHWVDALTGQDLNRWFPLTAPSDFLFFLPPRKSVDSAKKLRLISSAARPSERSAIVERAYGIQTRSSPFWGHINWGSDHSEAEGSLGLNHANTGRLRTETRARVLGSRADSSDHYRAVPLSDGYHILFTDPATGLLCLGCDAPFGGPTKLLRKIWFQGPDSHTSVVCYVGGSDLTHGVRVVAAYGTGSEQTIWFFSVPSDVFEANHGPLVMSRSSPVRRPYVAGDNHNTEWANWWPDDGLQEWLAHAKDPAAGILHRSVWPVKIRGQCIGTCPSVVDLAIDAGPRMIVWVISAKAVAKAWRFDDGTAGGDAKKWVIARDGTARACDADGDVEMSDVRSSASSYRGSQDEDETPALVSAETFDGSASFCTSTVYKTRSARLHSDKWTLDHAERRSLQRELHEDVIMDDESGDIAMRDVDDGIEDIVISDVDGRNQAVGKQSLDRMAYESWLMAHARLSDGLSFMDYRFAEEEMGIVRLEVEIK